MNKKTAGILCILCAAIIWAIEPLLAKLSYSNSGYLETSAIRTFFVAVIALAYALITNKGNVKVNKKEANALLAKALIGTLFADTMYMYALSKVPSLNAVIIGHLQPVFIILIGFFIFHYDKLTKYDYFGIFFMLLAAFIVTTKTPQNFASMKFGTFGDAIVLLATIAWAMTTLITRYYLRHLNAGVVVFYRYGIASIVFAVYLFANSAFKISNIYQVYLGIAISIGVILYFEGLKRLKGAVAGSLELTAPFFAAVLGFVFLRETVTTMQIAGLLLLLAGIYFISRKEEIIWSG